MTSTTSLPADFCPYVGLAPYTESLSAFFFGRERDQKLIVSNLYAMPLTVLYGASGVGKTSVLLAWIVPELKRAPDVDFVIFREWHDVEFMTTLKRRVLTAAINGLNTKRDFELHAEEDGDLPSEKDDFRSSTSEQPNKKVLSELKARSDARQVLESLNADDSALAKMSLDELLRNCTLISDRKFFFIFDQFEEYFLYHPPSKASDSFDAELARVANRKDLPVRFLLSMRQEELGRLARFRGRIPNMLGNLVFLEHLDNDGAERAILEPLRVFNAQVSDPRTMEIEEELVAAVIRKSRQPGGGENSEGEIADETAPERPIKTPVLQILLTSLWEAEKKAGSHILRLSTLEQMGGAENIMRTYVDRVMNEIEEPQLNTAAEIFRYLVTPSGSKIAQTLSDLAGSTKSSRDLVNLTLKTLLASPVMQILRKVSIPGQEDRYEIFHDALGVPISDWRRRYEIRKDEQAEITRQQEIKRGRRRRLGVFALLIALIAMSGVTVYALVKRRSALVAQARAEALTLQVKTANQEETRQRLEADKQKGNYERAQEATKRQAERYEYETKLAKAQQHEKIEMAKRQEAEKQRNAIATLLAEKNRALDEFDSAKAEIADNTAEISKLKGDLTSTIVRARPGEYLGIDVSRHTGEIDWQKVRNQGIAFVLIKATQGVSFKDNRFAANWSGAKGVNIARGAYHYFDANDDPAKQAEQFLQTIGDDTDLPAILDMEYSPGLRKPDPESVTRGMRIWLRAVEQKTRCRPIIYTTPSFANEFFHWDEFSKYPLWIGFFSSAGEPRLPRMWKDWTIWQYTYQGRVDGIPDVVGVNRMRIASLDQLRCKK